MLQLELILLRCSFISVVFRAPAPSQPSSLPLQSPPVFSCSPPLLCWAVPCRDSPPHELSPLPPGSARGAAGPGSGTGTNTNSALWSMQTVSGAPGCRERPAISWMWERCSSQGGCQRGGGERLFSLRRARQQFRTTSECLLNVWKLQS